MKKIVIEVLEPESDRCKLRCEEDEVVKIDGTVCTSWAEVIKIAGVSFPDLKIPNY